MGEAFQNEQPGRRGGGVASERGFRIKGLGFILQGLGLTQVRWRSVAGRAPLAKQPLERHLI